MVRSFFVFSIISLFSSCLQAQDAATADGQKALECRTRYYSGTGIRKFSAKQFDLKLSGKKFTRASPAIYGGVLYAGTDANCAVSIVNHEVKTTYELENAGTVEGSPAVTKDYVFLGFSNNLFACFNREDGKLLWKYETKGPVTTTPLAHDDMVYCTTSNGYCYAFKSERGTFKWRFNALSKVSSPAYEKDVVYVGNDRQCMYAINAKNGDQIWRYIGAGGQPVIGELRIYASEKIGTVVAIDKRNGHPDWEFRGHLIEGTTDFALENNTLVFGNGTTVFALDSRSGEGFKWDKELRHPLASPPIIVGNVVYITCLDGNIYALDLGYGDELGKFELGFTPNSSPSFSKELLMTNGEQMLFISEE